jgi:hypothetical protein
LFPVATTHEYAQASGRCCFCHKELTDPTSMQIGVSTYGLKWAAPQNHEQVARLRGRRVTGERRLAHLKAKAGLSRDHWSPNFRASRFSVKQTVEEELHPSTFKAGCRVA